MADSEISLLKRGDPSRRWLALAWLVLIAFRTFRPLFGEARTRAAIQGVLARRFKKRTHAYMLDRFGISQDRPQEAFEQVARNYQARGATLFGSRFTYVQVVQSPSQSHTYITKCLFNDFFRSHGAAEVVPLFCALDAIWIEELHRPCYRTRFERPTTLARGDRECRFCFSRAPEELPTVRASSGHDCDLGCAAVARNNDRVT